MKLGLRVHFYEVFMLCVLVGKPVKRASVGGQTSKPSSIKPLRKIALSSSSSSSATKLPLHRYSNSDLSPSAGHGRVVDKLRTAVTLASAKPISNSAPSRRSVSRVTSTAVACGSGTQTLTLDHSHKPTVEAKSG